MIELNHDGELIISTGRHRKDTAFKKRKILWSTLVNKLSETQRTHELYRDYLKGSPDYKDNIKDVGGFVGGLLSTGRRKKDNVIERCLVTLDLDFCEYDFWTDFLFMYDCAACLYSTHKHSPATPRYRLVLPLDRTITPDEYLAISRKIAGALGIDQFDPTTFQAERLMYYPSTSKDGEFIFEYQDGEFLKADDVLGSYIDWRDVSEWPLHELEKEAVNHDRKKQGEPTEKPGLIGAFCRQYTIQDAILTYLTDVYEPVDNSDDRYTYTGGSTSGGLVVYDNVFAYSHHGTDPTSGKLCNAFDLVRLHKFGLKDEDAPKDTPIHRMPSYKAMADLVAKDKEVVGMMALERRAEAVEDFGTWDDEPEKGTDESATEADLSFLKELEADKDGNLKPTIDNCVKILTNDPNLAGRLAYDEFEGLEIAVKSLPWRKVTDYTRVLDEKDDAALRHYFEHTYGINHKGNITDAVYVYILRNTIHPVRDYLDSLKWDGVPRIDRLLTVYLGAEDTPYTRAVSRKMLAAGAARIYSPGEKFDYCCALLGLEGKGKSTFISKLGQKWFTDSFYTFQGREAAEQIQGVWMVEIGELSALNRAENNTVKHFISMQVDRYRSAYARRIQSRPRQCVFWATGNKKDILKGQNGDRKFWPVDIWEVAPEKDIFDEDALSQHEVDQIWAEAVAAYKGGETLCLSADLEDAAREQQRGHVEDDPREALLHTFLDMPITEDWYSMEMHERKAYIRDYNTGMEMIAKGTVRRDKVCVAEIYCELFEGRPAEMTNYNTRVFHDFMNRAPGWTVNKNKLRFGPYGVAKAFVRVGSTFEEL